MSRLDLARTIGGVAGVAAGLGTTVWAYSATSWPDTFENAFMNVFFMVFAVWAGVYAGYAAYAVVASLVAGRNMADDRDVA